MSAMLACDIDRMTGEGVDRGRANPHVTGRAGNFQQRQPRRLVEHVVVDRDGVKAIGFGLGCQRTVSGEGFIGLEGDGKHSDWDRRMRVVDWLGNCRWSMGDCQLLGRLYWRDCCSIWTTSKIRS